MRFTNILSLDTLDRLEEDSLLFRKQTQLGSLTEAFAVFSVPCSLVHLFFFFLTKIKSRRVKSSN